MYKKNYTYAELAELFPLSTRTFRKWIGAGYFGKITKSGMLMATYLEVEKFLTERGK